MRLAELVATDLLAKLPAGAGAAVFRRGAHMVVGAEPDELLVAHGGETLDALDRLGGEGTWVGWCAFELGHALERVHPRAASLAPATLPDAGGGVYARNSLTGDIGLVAYPRGRVNPFVHYGRSYRHPNLEEMLFAGPATAGTSTS